MVRQNMAQSVLGSVIGSSVTRRELLLHSTRLAAGGFFATTLAAGPIGSAFAQSMSTSELDYPELTITITKDGLQPSATQIPAGFILMTVVNQLEGDDNSDSVGLLGPGPDQTMEQLQEASATPAPDDGFPPFLYDAVVLGGPGAIPPGTSSQVIINVPPGDWAVFDGGKLPPVFITAVSGTPTSQIPPSAATTIIEVDFAFGGLDHALPAGEQIWEVVNQSKQPHMLSVVGVPAGTTVEQILEAITRPEDATPPAGGLTDQDFHPVNGGILLQSPGITVWPIINLEPGHYAAVCFVTDPNTGMPHIMLGMVATFDVGETTATPTS